MKAFAVIGCFVGTLLLGIAGGLSFSGQDLTSDAVTMPIDWGLQQCLADLDQLTASDQEVDLVIMLARLEEAIARADRPDLNLVTWR